MKKYNYYKMTLAQFNQLDYAEKLLACNDGVCVGGRDEGKFSVLLYQLCAFYVEVYYHKKYSYVSALDGFDDTDRLEPYLRKISIKELAH